MTRSPAALVLGALTLALLAGCGGTTDGGDPQMVTADEAKAQMLAEVEAVQALIGEGWTTDDELGVPGACSQPDGGSGGSWQLDTQGSVTVAAAEAAEIVSTHLEGRGFTVTMRDSGDYGIDVVAFQADGLALQFGVGHNGFASLDAQSVCFPKD